jgi:hypothetical protein
VRSTGQGQRYIFYIIKEVYNMYKVEAVAGGTTFVPTSLPLPLIYRHEDILKCA